MTICELRQTLTEINNQNMTVKELRARGTGQGNLPQRPAQDDYRKVRAKTPISVDDGRAERVEQNEKSRHYSRKPDGKRVQSI